MWANLQKLLTFFQQNICELDIVLTRTVNILTTNELVKLTMLWTTEPWMLGLWVIRRSLHIDKIHKNKKNHSLTFQLCHENITNVAKMSIFGDGGRKIDPTNFCSELWFGIVYTDVIPIPPTASLQCTRMVPDDLLFVADFQILYSMLIHLGRVDSSITTLGLVYNQ